MWLKYTFNSKDIIVIYIHISNSKAKLLSSKYLIKCNDDAEKTAFSYNLEVNVKYDITCSR